MKTILTVAIALTLLTGVFALTQSATAKDSTCDVSAGGKCVIVAKRGDIEIDKLTIIVGVPGTGPPGQNGTDGAPGQNGTSLDNQTLADISTIVDAFRAGNLTGGITEIEISPVNETVPEPTPGNDTGGNITG